MQGLNNRITPEEAAMFTAYLIHTYEQAKGKAVTRCRLGRGSVRLLGIRSTLREAFVLEWIEALATDWGWVAFPVGEEFGLVRISAVEDWVKLGTKRVADIRKRLKKGDRSALDEMRDELGDTEGEDEDDGDE